MPTSKRRHDDEEEDRKPNTMQRGWEAFAKKSKEVDDNKSFTPEFYLRSGETNAIIQFLDDEPVIFDAHNVKQGKFFKILACQKSIQKHCTLCREGSRPSMKVVFRILDYRGKYNSEKERYEGGTPLEKYWVVGQRLGNIIAAVREKSKKTLTEQVFEVTKTGKKQNVSWLLEKAFDEDDVLLKPKRHTITLKPAEETYRPKTDDELDGIDYELPEDED